MDTIPLFTNGWEASEKVKENKFTRKSDLVIFPGQPSFT